MGTWRLSLLLGIQWRTPSSSGWRSRFLLLQSWPQGYHAFPFFELFLLSIMPRFFSVANPPGFLLLGWVSHLLTWLLPSLLHNNLPCSGQLFWSPVPVLHSSFFIFLWLFLYFFFLLHIFTPASSSFPYPFICSCLTAFLSFFPFYSFLPDFVISSTESSSELIHIVNFNFLLKL